MAVELGSEHLCCNHTLQCFYLQWCRISGSATLRRADVEQFGCADNCPGCPNAGAGREQAVDHENIAVPDWRQILVTTTEGHMRLEWAKGRFAHFAEEPSVVESPRKRHRPEGEGRGSL